MPIFSNNWVKENKVKTYERLKASIRIQQPLKPRVEFASGIIQTQSQKIDVILEQLKAKEKSLLNQVVAHLQKHDMRQGKMISNELAQVRKTTQMILRLKMTLEQTRLRLESTINLGDVMVAMGPAMGALTRIRSGLSVVIPDMDTQVKEINGVFSEILMNAANMGINSSISLDADSEEIDEIISEASVVAEQRMNDSFPDVPVGTYSTNGSRPSMDEPPQ